MPSFTKNEIKRCFVELLDERPLNQITVKEIVEKCGINRNSFYYHFQDIPTLIEELVMEDADQIIAQYPTIDSIEMCLNAALSFAKQRSRALLHIYNSVSRSLFEQYLWKVCDYVVTTYAQTVFEGKSMKEYDRDLIIRFYKCECFGVVIEWMDGGMKEDIQQSIIRICELKKGMLEEIIERSLCNN